MLSTAIEYAVRPADRRRKNGKNLHIKSSNHVTKFVFAQTSGKCTFEIIISLKATLRTYILGTVRMSLLHVLMFRMMALPIVPNIKETA
jgi:hypothetical protein